MKGNNRGRPASRPREEDQRVREKRWTAARSSSLFVPGDHRIARGERIGDAVLDVVVEELERDALERGLHGGDLREDVDAVAILLDHPLDPAHLALDPVQPLDERLLVLRVAVRHVDRDLPRSSWKRRSRRLFVTTKTLENAIAAAATIGFSRPATASGIAATL